MNFKKYCNINNIKDGDEYSAYRNRLEGYLNNFFPTVSSLTNKQKNMISEIVENKNKIFKALDQFSELGIHFKIELAGGAIRDFILNRTEEINDYDFILYPDFYGKKNEANVFDYFKEILNVNELSFLNEDMLESEKRVKEYTEQKTICSPKNFIKSLDFYRDIDLFATSSVVGGLLVKNGIELSVFKNAAIKKVYLNNRIERIYKFNGFGDKKVDLIVPNIQLGFVDTFDFEICKGVVDLTDLNNVGDYEGFINNMNLRPGMLRDLSEKRLSISLDKFNIDDLDYFLNKHYVKLKEKFPDYDLGWFVRNSQADKENEKKFMKYFVLKNNIEDVQLHDIACKKIKI